MDRKQFLKSLFLGGAGLLVAPIIAAKIVQPDPYEGWIYVGDLLRDMPRGTQNHTHDGPSCDGVAVNHSHIGIDFDKLEASP